MTCDTSIFAYDISQEIKLASMRTIAHDDPTDELERAAVVMDAAKKTLITQVGTARLELSCLWLHQEQSKPFQESNMLRG